MASDIDQATGEPILLEIRTSAATHWNALDISSATTRVARTQKAPWRSIGFAIAGVVVATLLGAGTFIGGVLVSALAMGALEVWNRRDFLTPKRLVRQYGLLGNKRDVLLLADIERVEFSYPRFGKLLGAGDVEASGIGKGFTFVGVRDPEGLAQAILNARAGVLFRQDTDRRRIAARLIGGNGGAPPLG